MFTFDPGLSSHRDWVRLLTQDTDPQAPLLADETIAALVTALGYAPAVAQICDLLVAQYGSEPDYLQEHLGMEVRWSGRVAAWQDLAAKARAGLVADPFASTISSHNAALRQTAIQRATPARPLPSYVPTGVLGGFRTE